MNSHSKQYNIKELLIRFLENDLNDSQRIQLLAWSRSDPKAVKEYCDFVKDHTILRSVISEQIEPKYGYSDDTQFDIALWAALQEDQETAPEIEIQEKPTHELNHKVIYPPREKRKINKFQIFTLVMSAAALFFIVLFVKLTPQHYSIEVATLVDQINAKCAESSINYEVGDRLSTNQMPLCLDKGILKIQYDNGVDVLIESPAKFTIERSGIYFEYGRLFSHVPQTGLGFLVETPTARFVDLGTEFGVQADVNGSVELHVIKGKVQLFAGMQRDAKSSQTLVENKAVRYDVNTEKVETVPVHANAFVRTIDSRTKTVWRGQMQINLANVVAGDDGFREMSSLTGLNPATGERVTSITETYRKGNNAYTLVPDSQFIDGVFVPNDEADATQITSLGQTFDCPDAKREFTHEIAAYKGSVKNLQTTIPPAVINGQEVVKDPVLMLHSNSGITFDLQAIRESLPQVNLAYLKATGAPLQGVGSDMDFWVLVDGQVKYERKIELNGSDRNAIPFSVEFNQADRFLTLIVTDGPSGSFASDFFYLIKPQLVLQ